MNIDLGGWDSGFSRGVSPVLYNMDMKEKEISEANPVTTRNIDSVILFLVSLAAEQVVSQLANTSVLFEAN